MKLTHPAYTMAGPACYVGALASDKTNFTIDLSPSRMFELVKQAQLPAHEEYPGLGESLGIDLHTLQSMKDHWISSFDWAHEQTTLNEYHHYTATIENLKVHFIHEHSSEPSAIPLILIHGWPGSFAELVPLIHPLTTAAKTSKGAPVSFDVVIPSLPGYMFSSAPPANWTLDDTARIYNTLMTEVLGYKTYAVHGTDWGSNIAYSMYDKFSTTVRAAHLLGIPFFPLSPDQLSDRNITLDENEQFQEDLVLKFQATGAGYQMEQSTKPNTIGLALYDNPVGQLAWIGEKYIEWSDPRALKTPPSVLTYNHIILEVSLYYLTKSFVSSVFTYAQNAAAFKANYTKARTDAPMLFSSFKYNFGFWTKEVISWVGNLVLYNFHDFGGHFPALENPSDLTGDIREIADYWSSDSS
ncbi:Alpha/Beta hydrolase protein [Xylaria sp. FL0043]|nr:Alpha/Beta hydrolase protein [Xylaria sp. FL0043]